MNSFEKYYSLLKQYVDYHSIVELYNMWNHYKRKYHNLNHLNEVIQCIENNSKLINEEEFDILILAAFFHDAIYDPTRQDNEDRSINFFKYYFNDDDPTSTNEYIKNKVIEIIECTKYRKRPKDKLSKLFWEADNHMFIQGFAKLLYNEKMLNVEFNHVPRKIYKEKRKEFLKTNIGLFNSKVDKDINKLIDWVDKNY